MAYYIEPVIKEHDPECFQVVCYTNIHIHDEVSERIKNYADQWRDITRFPDEIAARLIREDEIDILVDLNGYTRDARTAVFARRSAPIQVNWFGFPGTMGTPYHHYLIADENVVPPGHEIFFSEKVMRLPCYQPNDRKRRVAPEAHAEPSPTASGSGTPTPA